jgi:hypothetical protein
LQLAKLVISGALLMLSFGIFKILFPFYILRLILIGERDNLLQLPIDYFEADLNGLPGMRSRLPTAN